MSKLVFNAFFLIMISPFAVFSATTYKTKMDQGKFMTQQSSTSIEVLKGSEAIPYLNKLMEIRLLFYRDYPYLYDGSIEDEENYLRIWSNSENTLLVVAKRNDKVVGVIIGLPFSESPEENKQAFQNLETSPEDLFYLGDNIVIQELKVGNVQKQMYHQFERAVKQLKKYKEIVVCEIERDVNDPKKIANDTFYEFSWNAQGFIREPNQIVNFTWKEIGDSKISNHHMVFWRKPL